MIVTFLRGDKSLAQEIGIETSRILVLEWGDYCNGKPATRINFDNGDSLLVRGDMSEVSEKINHVRKIEMAQQLTE